jgi:hypothetical protein
MGFPLWSLGPPVGVMCHQGTARPSQVTVRVAWCQTGDAAEASSP